MAIFSKLILGSAILSSIALAAPFHGKAAWTVTDYTTIDITTTIYIDDSKTMSGAFQPTFVPQTTGTSGTSVAVETSSPSAVSPPIASTPAAPIPNASPPSIYTPEISTPPATTPAAVVTSSSSTAAAAAVPISSAALAKNAGTGAPSSASDTASCQGEGAACLGDITYYGGGLGACGVNVDPSGNGIALAAEFMGSESNDNPYCGKTMTIYNPATGESVQGTVMDKCPGCSGRSIDMMQGLMDDLTNGQATLLGRVHNVEWWFN